MFFSIRNRSNERWLSLLGRCWQSEIEQNSGVGHQRGNYDSGHISNVINLFFKRKERFNVRKDTVCFWAIQAVWNSETMSNGDYVEVEIVVYQVELRGRRKRTSGTVDFTG